MLCTGQTILILPLHVVVECYLPGHIHMARCIRLLCVALMYNISIRNAVLPFARELISIPVFFMHTPMQRNMPLEWRIGGARVEKKGFSLLDCSDSIHI